MTIDADATLCVRTLTSIKVCFDDGWQKRSTGFMFNSPSGVAHDEHSAMGEMVAEASPAVPSLIAPTYTSGMGVVTSFTALTGAVAPAPGASSAFAAP